MGDRYYIGRLRRVHIQSSGGVRFDNTTDALDLDKVTVAIGTKRYDETDDLSPAAQLVVPAPAR